MRRYKESSKKDLIAPHFERSRDGYLPSVPPPRPNSQGEARRQVHKSAKSPKNKKNLPSEFKCHGQFCDLLTVDPAPLQSSDDDRGSNRERALRISKQVLSANELEQLSSSGKLLQLGVTRRDPLAYKAVSQKSIIRAKEEVSSSKFTNILWMAWNFNTAKTTSRAIRFARRRIERL